MPVRPAEMKGLGLRIMHNPTSIIGAILTINPAKQPVRGVTCLLMRTNHAPEKTREASPDPDC